MSSNSCSSYFDITKNTDTDISYDVVVCGNPVDITGWTFYFSATANPSYPSAVTSLFLSQSVHTDPVNGKTSFPVSASQTADLISAKYYYEVTSMDTEGKLASWTNSAFYLVQNIPSL